MKKILLIIVIACVGFLSSCKRDERELKSLAGTTWRCDFDVDEVFELNFESGIVKLIYTKDEEISEQTGAYTYAYPEFMAEMETFDMDGRVSGNTLTVWGLFPSGGGVEFKKQKE